MKRVGLTFIGFAVALYCTWILGPSVMLSKSPNMDSNLFEAFMGYMQSRVLAPVLLVSVAGIVFFCLGFKENATKE